MSVNSDSKRIFWRSWPPPSAKAGFFSQPCSVPGLMSGHKAFSPLVTSPPSTPRLAAFLALRPVSWHHASAATIWPCWSTAPFGDARSCQRALPRFSRHVSTRFRFFPAFSAASRRVTSTTSGSPAICGPSTATDAPMSMPVRSSKVCLCPTPAPSATAEAMPGAFAPHWTTLRYLQAEIILPVVAVPTAGPARGCPTAASSSALCSPQVRCASSAPPTLTSTESS